MPLRRRSAWRDVALREAAFLRIAPTHHYSLVFRVAIAHRSPSAAVGGSAACSGLAGLRSLPRYPRGSLAPRAQALSANGIFRRRLGFTAISIFRYW